MTRIALSVAHLIPASVPANILFSAADKILLECIRVCHELLLYNRRLSSCDIASHASI